MKIFNSPNELAENLSCKDNKESLSIITNEKLPHLSKSQYDYLGGIETLEYLKKSIFFVGTVENMKRDNILLNKKLGFKNEIIHYHKTNGSIYLSDKAVLNIKNFYKKDYIIIDWLIKNNFIPKNYKNQIGI